MGAGGQPSAGRARLRVGLRDRGGFEPRPGPRSLAAADSAGGSEARGAPARGDAAAARSDAPCGALRDAFAPTPRLVLCCSRCGRTARHCPALARPWPPHDGGDSPGAATTALFWRVGFGAQFVSVRRPQAPHPGTQPAAAPPRPEAGSAFRTRVFGRGERLRKDSTTRVSRVLLSPSLLFAVALRRPSARQRRRGRAWSAAFVGAGRGLRVAVTAGRLPEGWGWLLPGPSVAPAAQRD